MSQSIFDVDILPNDLVMRKAQLGDFCKVPICDRNWQRHETKPHEVRLGPTSSARQEWKL